MLEESKNKQHFIKNIPFLTLGWELALPIFGGVFLGYHLDRYFESQYLLTIVMLVFGLITGYYSLYKYIELEILRTKLHKYQQQKEN